MTVPEPPPGMHGLSQKYLRGALGDLDHFIWRVVQDALEQANWMWWARRARELEKARHRPGDFTGAASPAEIAERDAALRLAAENCRRHARLLRERS